MTPLISTTLWASFLVFACRISENCVAAVVPVEDPGVDEATCQADGTWCNAPNLSKDPAKECGVWVAMSTIPGSGIGMYAGKSFKSGEYLMMTG
jgi:hypothetical protein